MSDLAADPHSAGDPAATFRDVVTGIVEEPLAQVRKQVSDAVNSVAEILRTGQTRLRQDVDEMRRGPGEHAYTLPELANAMRDIEQCLRVLDETMRQAADVAAAELRGGTQRLLDELEAQAARHEASIAGVRSATDNTTRLTESLSADLGNVRQEITANRRLAVGAVATMVLLAAASVAILLLLR